MRNLIVTENMTLDGVIDLAGGWFDPLAAGRADMAAVTAEHSRGADGLLLGRRTFEAFRAFWPNQTEDPTGVAGYLNRVRKYVVSSTLTETGWENTELLTGDLVEEVGRLKGAEGCDIVATGSMQLVHALIAGGLVDEHRLFVFPIVVGTGVRLFDAADVALRLLETRSFVSGAVLLSYGTNGAQ